MKHRPKVSVCIPVYNTERYLEQCIESVVTQTLEDLEIILVDDGSSDNSPEMCDSWAKRDRRIIVSHTPNGGLGRARQCGLDLATGEYVIHCDSDDWVEPDTYEKAYLKAKAEDADVVMFGYFAEYENRHSEIWVRTFQNLQDVELTRKEIMQHSWFHGWNKLVRTDLFKTNGIYFEPDINMGEDALMLHKILSIPGLKLSNIEAPYYHYRLGTGGYTTNLSERSIDQMLFIHNWQMENLNLIYHQEGLLKFTADIAFESLRCTTFPPKKFREITSKLSCLYLCRSPRSFQKLNVLIGKLFGWKCGRCAYKFLFSQRR